MDKEAILSEVEKKFLLIQNDENLNQYQKDLRTAELMTFIEDIFEIPLIKDDEHWSEFKKNNPTFVSFYTLLSESRNSLWQ